MPTVFGYSFNWSTVFLVLVIAGLVAAVITICIIQPGFDEEPSISPSPLPPPTPDTGCTGLSAGLGAPDNFAGYTYDDPAWSTQPAFAPPPATAQPPAVPPSSSFDLVGLEPSAGQSQEPNSLAEVVAGQHRAHATAVRGLFAMPKPPLARDRAPHAPVVLAPPPIVEPNNTTAPTPSLHTAPAPQNPAPAPQNPAPAPQNSASAAAPAALGAAPPGATPVTAPAPPAATPASVVVAAHVAPAPQVPAPSGAPASDAPAPSTVVPAGTFALGAAAVSPARRTAVAAAVPVPASPAPSVAGSLRSRAESIRSRSSAVVGGLMSVPIAWSLVERRQKDVLQAFEACTQKQAGKAAGLEACFGALESAWAATLPTLNPGNNSTPPSPGGIDTNNSTATATATAAATGGAAAAAAGGGSPSVVGADTPIVDELDLAIERFMQCMDSGDASNDRQTCVEALMKAITHAFPAALLDSNQQVELAEARNELAECMQTSSSVQQDFACLRAFYEQMIYDHSLPVRPCTPVPRVFASPRGLTLACFHEATETFLASLKAAHAGGSTPSFQRGDAALLAEYQALLKTCSCLVNSGEDCAPQQQQQASPALSAPATPAPPTPRPIAS